MGNNDPDHHRTFMRLQLMRGSYFWVTATGEPYRAARPGERPFKAHRFIGGAFDDVDVFPHDGQDFWRFATDWERTFSVLCWSSSGQAVPVVDAGLTVIAHSGVFQGSNVFVRKEATRLSAGEPAFVRALPPPKSHYRSLTGGADYDVLVTPDGAVREIELLYRSDAVEPSLSPVDLINLGKIGLMVSRVVFVSARGCRLKSIELKGRPRVTDESPTALLAERAARETAETAASQVGGVARRVGRVSAEEMAQYLTQVLQRRPDLRRLIAARTMTGQGRMDAINIALREFEQTQRWAVVEKSAAEMEAVTTRNNLVTLRADVRQVWINRDRANRWDPEKFYEHVVHDLSAHALAGRGGVLNASDVPFLGVEFRSGLTDGLSILEQSIRHYGGTEWISRTFGPRS